MSINDVSSKEEDFYSGNDISGTMSEDVVLFATIEQTCQKESYYTRPKKCVFTQLAVCPKRMQKQDGILRFQKSDNETKLPSDNWNNIDIAMETARCEQVNERADPKQILIYTDD